MHHRDADHVRASGEASITALSQAHHGIWGGIGGEDVVKHTASLTCLFVVVRIRSRSLPFLEPVARVLERSSAHWHLRDDNAQGSMKCVSTRGNIKPQPVSDLLSCCAMSISRNYVITLELSCRRARITDGATKSEKRQNDSESRRHHTVPFSLSVLQLGQL